MSLWGQHDIDGHICQSVDDADSEGNVPASTLSRYFGSAVLLIVKGRKARPCAPTHEFPLLQANTHYQDGYPLLIASEESLIAVQNRMRQEVGRQGVEDRWKVDKLEIERYRGFIVHAIVL